MILSLMELMVGVETFLFETEAPRKDTPSVATPSAAARVGARDFVVDSFPSQGTGMDTVHLVKTSSNVFSFIDLLRAVHSDSSGTDDAKRPDVYLNNVTQRTGRAVLLRTLLARAAVIGENIRCQCLL